MTTLANLETLLADHASAHDDDEIRAEHGITFGMVRDVTTLAALRTDPDAQSRSALREALTDLIWHQGYISRSEAETRADAFLAGSLKRIIPGLADSEHPPTAKGSDLDERATSDVHEEVARLIWLRIYHRDFHRSWEDAKQAKEWSALYRAASDAYLTAADFIFTAKDYKGVLEEFAAERRRQIEKGYNRVHDDRHSPQELARAAAAYAMAADEPLFSPPSCWPWNREAWRPEGPRENLIKSLALGVAAIERMDREARRLNPPIRVPDRLPPRPNVEGAGIVMDEAYAAAKASRTRGDMEEVTQQFAETHGEEKGRASWQVLVLLADHQPRMTKRETSPVSRHQPDMTNDRINPV